MLQCRTAARDIFKGCVRFHLNGLVGTSNWQKQSHCHFSSRKARPRVTRRKQSQLQISEKQTLQEIKQLRSSLERLEKNDEAQREQAGLEEMNEETLDTIYEALQAPDPPLVQEIRLEAKRRRKRRDKFIEGREVIFTDTLHGRKIVERLVRLTRRLAEIRKANQSEEEPTVSAYERKTFLLEQREVEGALKDTSGEDSDSLEDATNSHAEGLAIFNNTRRCQDVLDQLESISIAFRKRASDNEIPNELVLPLGVATIQEWEALCASFAHHDDVERVCRTLKIARRSGHSSCLTKAANAALEVYASRGATTKCQDLVDWMAQNEVQIDKYTNHCLVKSFVVVKDFNEVFSILHHLEDQRPASLETYTYVMGALLKQKDNSGLQQMIWPLFHRMRLVAHSVPDAPCYAKLIRACSLGIAQPNESFWKPSSNAITQTNDAIHRVSKMGKEFADAERALDLFREMTDRYSIRPNADVYSALISACAKRQDMYEKALQLFKNMIELERSRIEAINQKIDLIEDFPSYAPTREVFNAVLSGCAKNADLMRARWILAEMLRSAAVRWKEIMSKKGEGAILAQWEISDFEERLPDAETLSKVFYTYASYKPTPHNLKTTEKTSTKCTATFFQSSKEGASILVHNDSIKDQKSLLEEDAGKNESTLSHILPRTRKALIAEANALMERIKVDFEAHEGLLSVISPDASLLNSYLAVLSRHADKDDARNQVEAVVFGESHSDRQDDKQSLFDYFNVKMNRHTCEVVLEACCRMERGDDVYDLASRIWSEWIQLGGDQSGTAKLRDDSTTISRVWSAMIQVSAKNQRLVEAMHLLRQFAQLYPPLASLGTSSTTIFTSTGRLLMPDPDSTIASTPILTFKQVERLHLRLVESEGRREDIKYLTWLVKSYEYSVKPKKPFSLRGDPAPASRQEAIRRLLSQSRYNYHDRSRFNVD